MNRKLEPIPTVGALHRNRCLDGLRGYAALIVVVAHFIAAFWPTAFFRGGSGWSNVFSESPLHVFINGTFSVYVFFVLSGYVLAGANGVKFDGLPRQIFARYIRLGVPASASLVLAFVILLLYLSRIPEAVALNGNAWLERRFAPETYSWTEAAADMAGRYFLTGKSPLNQVLWTMQAEFLGSVMIFSVSCALTKPKARIFLYLLLGLCFLYYGRQVRLMMCFIPFVAGALMRESGFSEREKYRWVAWVLLFVGLTLGGTPYQDAQHTVYMPLIAAITPFTQYPFDFLKIAGAIILVFSVIWLRVRFFESKLALWLGDISFSSYLLHMLVLVSFASFIYSLMGPKLLIVQGAVFVVVSLGLAAVFHRFVDTNAIKWSRRIKD